tara:strand:+ start:553 stop:756 length:204 start_codon:yes stop_codon:yes gene_type:complete
MAPRSKGKADMIKGAIDEDDEDEYDNWVNKNREVRNSITELPGDLPERAFSKSTTKRMDKNSRSSKR